MRHLSTPVLLLALLVGCNDEVPPPIDLEPLIAQAEATYSDAALTYLRAAFDTIETHHVYGDAYDWEELWLATLETGEGATTVDETHDALRFALADLNDPHTGFGIYPDSLSSSDPDGSASDRTVEMPPMTAKLIDDKIGYVEIPRFGWPVGDVADAYATNLQDLIRRLDVQRPCGWVVDVRRNTGGNMWPMIAGAGPLIGEGEVGAFVDRDGGRMVWTYRDGTAAVDTLSVSVSGEPVGMPDAPPVAVLTSSRTGSAAEAVVVAFRGLPNVQTFGKPTAGATTSPGYFDFEEGMWMRFSVLYYADRRGTIYRGPIEPDVPVETDMWDDHAAAESTAVEWLLDTAACG